MFSRINRVIQPLRQHRLLLWCMVVAGIGGGTFGFAVEYWGHWPSCILCHIERWILLIWGGSALLSLRCRRNLWALWILSIVGWAVALYHTMLQFRLFQVPAFCQIKQTSSFQEFMSQPTAACQEWTLSMFGLPAPFYLMLMWFFAIVIVWRFCRTRT